jgi:hypothetical protein
MEAATSTARSPARLPPGTPLALLLSALGAAVVAWGLIADAAGVGLGTLNPPFFVSWEPDIDLGALAWLALLAGSAAAAVALARGAAGTATFLLGTTGLALVGRLALAAARDGTGAWYAVFGADPEAANEYLPALPALDDLGVGSFLDRFAELSPSLPIHASAHPPGLLLLLDGLGIDGARGMAALVIAAGVASVPLTYALGRKLDLEAGRARIAALLVAFSPAMMIYGVVSADALFATLGVAVAVPLVASGIATRAAGAVGLAVASFFSWALLAIGAFAAVVVALREGVRSALALGAGAAAALAVFYGLLYAATGYDPFGVLAAANEAYELGISNARPWAFWVLGSPVAFFVALGLPITWYAARALGTGADAAIGLAVIVIVASAVGFSKAETERIWLFMAPLACVAAAQLVPRRRLGAVIALLLAQAALAELMLETVW